VRLRWPSVAKGKYFVYVSGEFAKNRCTVSTESGSVSTTLDGNGIFFVGQLDIVSSLRLNLDGSGVIDQLLLVPSSFGVSFEFENQSWTVAYSVEETKGLIIVPERYFQRQMIRRDQVFGVSSEQIDHFLLLRLDEVFNNDGFALPQKPGNFDNLGGAVGAYLPEGETTEGVKIIGGTPFLLKMSGLDNFRVSDQKLVLPEDVKVKNVHLLASSNHGDYELTLALNGHRFSLLISDWCRGQKDLMFDFRYTASGQKEFIKCGLNVHTIELNKTIKEITFTGNINIHVFAVTLELEIE